MALVTDSSMTNLSALRWWSGPSYDRWLHRSQAPAIVCGPHTYTSKRLGHRPHPQATCAIAWTDELGHVAKLVLPGAGQPALPSDRDGVVHGLDAVQARCYGVVQWVTLKIVGRLFFTTLPFAVFPHSHHVATARLST